MLSRMDGMGERECSHQEGLWALAASEFQCPVCRARLVVEEVEQWVREAERSRDEAYLTVEDGEIGRASREARQREVYRRRGVLYELRNTPRGEVSRPEMILVSYDAASDAYDCRIFYKEPRPVRGTERINMEADLDHILELRSHPDPNIRLASNKAEEFHALRERRLGKGVPPPPRRVYYSNEL